MSLILFLNINTIEERIARLVKYSYAQKATSNHFLIRYFDLSNIEKGPNKTDKNNHKQKNQYQFVI